MSTKTGSLPMARRCERCGASLSGYAPEGLCPACMLLGGLESRAEGCSAGSGENFPAPASPLTGQPGDHEPAAAKVGGGTVPCGVTETPGDKIGRYKLLQKIGEGGYGVVYMAEQEEPLRRRVALKVIKLGMDTRAVIARFEAERQALALMDHPNIAKVLERGQPRAVVRSS